MMKINKSKELVEGIKTILLLHSDLSKQNNKETQAMEIKMESKGLYGKELQFYEFYFLPVADRG